MSWVQQWSCRSLQASGQKRHLCHHSRILNTKIREPFDNLQVKDNFKFIFFSTSYRLILPLRPISEVFLQYLPCFPNQCLVEVSPGGRRLVSWVVLPRLGQPALLWRWPQDYEWTQETPPACYLQWLEICNNEEFPM